MSQLGYNTRQKALVLKALISFGARPVTAEQLTEALKQQGERVGRATVYRQLDRLCAQGNARTVPGPAGAMYQYVDDASACKHHLHCQCTDCGRLFHVECDYLKELSGHLQGEHAFTLDPGRTVLLGRCEGCRKEKENGASDT